MTENLKSDAGFDHVDWDGNSLRIIGQGPQVDATARRENLSTETPQGATVNEVLADYTATVGRAGLVSIGRKDGRINVRVSEPDGVRDGYQVSPAEFGANRQITIEESEPLRPSASVQPGQGIYFVNPNSGGLWCSAGFPAYGPDGKDALLTAGHCTLDNSLKNVNADTPANDPAMSGKPPTAPSKGVGSLKWAQFGGVNNASYDDATGATGTDLAVILATAGTVVSPEAVKWKPQNTIARISAEQDPVPNMTYCASGSVSGWRCTTVTETEQIFFVNGQRSSTDQRAMTGFFMNFASQPGDSGGPVIGSYNTAVGLVSASANNQTVAIPISDVARYQPGYRLHHWIPTPTVDGAHPIDQPDRLTATWSGGTKVNGTVPGAAAGTTVNIAVDGTIVTTATTGANGSFTFTLPASAGTAAHTITITAQQGYDKSTPLTVLTPFVVPAGPIHDKWVATGSDAGILGKPTGLQRCGLVNGGCYQTFEKGSVYYSPASGAHWIRGSINDKWGALGWEAGLAGYPTTDEICGLRDGGCYQNFQCDKVSIYWSPTTGPHWIRGKFMDTWGSIGWEGGFAGYPTTDEVCGIRSNGCYQHFQRERTSIYYSSSTGTHWIRGSIKDKWAAEGYENSKVGYPSGDEHCGLKGGGCFQRFEKNIFSDVLMSIYWSPTTGAHSVRASGILDNWAAAGFENGRYGYPVGDTMYDPNSSFTPYGQQFQGGNLTSLLG